MMKKILLPIALILATTTSVHAEYWNSWRARHFYYENKSCQEELAKYKRQSSEDNMYLRRQNAALKRELDNRSNCTTYEVVSVDESEVAELKARLEQLEMENSILKERLFDLIDGN